VPSLHAKACNADSSTAADHIETTRLARPLSGL
jgi:hypothetical protein